MKRFSEQMHKRAMAIRLSTEERALLREQLVSYMEYHPMTKGAEKIAPSRSKGGALAETYTFVRIPQHLVRGFALLSVLIIIVGVPSLAERSVPGDVLYPVKVQFNEELRGQFAGTGYEKIAWETERLERRISEARVLAKEGKLTPEIEAGVIAAVNLHKEATEEEIATLRGSDGEAAALAELTLASVLDVQSAALKANDTGSTTRGMSTVAISTVLDEAQASLREGEHDEVSYETLMAQLERETTRGRELLASIEKDATPKERTDIERRLSDVERKVSVGMSLAATDQTAAVESLKATWRDMQTLITFMTDIDVRTTLALETLVPVVLTPEEEQALAREAYAEANNNLAIINERLPQVTDSGVREKVELTLPEVNNLLAKATSSLESDAVAAKVAAVEAREYTRSMLPWIEGVLPSEVLTATVAGSSTATTTDDVNTSSTTDDLPNETEESTI